MFDIAEGLAEVLGHPAHDASAMIDQIRGLEDLKNAATAEQARLTAELNELRRDEDADRGIPTARRGRGVAAEIALARRESVHRGQQHLAVATVLPTEMPRTWVAFRAGRSTEYRCQLLLRETACLERADRLRVDTEIAENPERLEVMGDRETVAEARRLAYQLDPASLVRRRAQAEADRHVSLRPAPDVMSQLSALLPVKAGVALYAALKTAADTAVATGDPRSRGQIMADTLVARVTGLTHEGADTLEPGVAFTINVLVPDTVLTGQSDEACHLEGYGTIPSDLARELAVEASWLRRLYTDPATGGLVAMEARSRLFPEALKKFISLRDRTCRMPWCDAPVRHTDHSQDAALGGPRARATDKASAWSTTTPSKPMDGRQGPAPDPATPSRPRPPPATPTPRPLPRRGNRATSNDNPGSGA